MLINSVYLSQSECKVCPEGYFCDGTLQNDTFCSHGVQNPEICIPGYYCPDGTNHSTEYPCPNGTFNAGTGLKAESECTPCTAGKFCETPGLSAPTGDCQAGYYCIEGAWIATPMDGTTGNICSVGSYCPMGSIATTPCPAGTYGPVEGNKMSLRRINILAEEITQSWKYFPEGYY